MELVDVLGLDRFVEAMAAADTVGEVAAAAVQGAVSLLAVEAAAVARVVGDRLDVEAASSAPCDVRDVLRAAGLGAAGTRSALEAGSVARVVAGTHVLAVPMRYRGDLRGALMLTAPAPLEADRLAGLVAAQCALALERTALAATEHTLHERMAFLAGASSLLAASLDPDETLSRLADIAVPRLADWCAVHLEEGAVIRQVALRHRDPEGHSAVDAVLRVLPVTRGMPYGAGAVIRSGRTQVLPEVPDEVLVAAADGDEELLARLRGLPLGAGIVVPLLGRERTLGAISLVRERRAPYDAGEVELAEDLGERAGLAVDNALVHSLARDAFRQRDAAAELADYERERLTALLEQLPVAVVLADAPSGRILLHNAATERIWGEPFARLQSIEDYDGVSATDATGAPVTLADWPIVRAVRHGEEVHGERFDLAWPGGSVTTIEVSAGPVRDRSGRVTAGVAAFTDVTDRVASERALVASERRALALSKTLQATLLPPALPEVPGLDLAAAYLPAAEGLDIGGDFYDVIETAREDEWALVIGDVCGKGAVAAGVTALARYTIRAATRRARRPAVILAALNEVMLHSAPARPFLTAGYVAVRQTPGAEAPHLATVAVGGHPLPLVLRADGRLEPVGRPGTLLGAFEEAEFTDETVPLHPGDNLLLYTDGLTEARRGSHLFGHAGVRAALVGYAGAPAHDVVARLSHAVEEFAGGEQRDDLALLVARVR